MHTAGLYLDAVLPDAMGMKKEPWFFLSPVYWGLRDDNAAQIRHVVPFGPTLPGQLRNLACLLLTELPGCAFLFDSHLLYSYVL